MIHAFEKSSRMGSATAAVLVLAIGYAVLAEEITPAKSQRNVAPTSYFATEGTPQIVMITPSVGATDVDPATSEIVVTFDRDMAHGFSWTGGGPDYPPRADGQKAHWRDTRTAVLPVKLEPGHCYRVGINSKSHFNFRSAADVPAQPSTIYFTTRRVSDVTATQKPTTRTGNQKQTEALAADAAVKRSAANKFQTPRSGVVRVSEDQNVEIPSGQNVTVIIERKKSPSEKLGDAFDRQYKAAEATKGIVRHIGESLAEYEARRKAAIDAALGDKGSKRAVVTQPKTSRNSVVRVSGDQNAEIPSGQNVTVIVERKKSQSEIRSEIADKQYKAAEATKGIVRHIGESLAEYEARRKAAIDAALGVKGGN